MYIPEWEIEELLTRNPGLLGFPSNELRLIERQKYLEKQGKYIDLLYKRGDAYLIVEIKAIRVDDKSVVTEQLLPYKEAFASECGLSEDKIVCVLISPNGFSEEVEILCQEAGIITRRLDQTSLVNAIKKLNLKPKYMQRELFANVASESILPKIRVQNEYAKRELAGLFVKISEKAPIEAHEVGTERDGKLLTNHDMWFWLFYSVMDRRANAATFVKAKQALEKERLFAPYKIVELLKEKGEKTTLNKIAKILEEADFPLLNDHVMRNLAFPKSIVDAAKFMSNYGYNFMQLYHEYVKAHQEDLIEARNSLWKDLQKKVYGVGPRIASQIIRGLVLKGPWKYPLNDNRFLEKCRFNVWIAGETRLNLIGSESEYYEQLGRFADDFLNENRGIIAHVLWYVRKKYCNRPPKCQDCPLSKHCQRAFSSRHK